MASDTRSTGFSPEPAGLGAGVAVGDGAAPATAAPAAPAGPAELPAQTPNDAAARFLIQATFGPTPASLAELVSGYRDDWFTAQKAAKPLDFQAWVDRRDAEIKAADPTGKAKAGTAQFEEAFWAAAVTGVDQLRQRMAFALSQIFVVSFQGSQITPRIAAAYYNTLLANSLGNYFDVLKSVTLSGAMGMYLNIVGNIQADTDPSRHPDENYAREIMQLMSIGLVQLNMDGSTVLQDGQPVPTYTHNDIAGLAKVFTGWGWYASRQTLGTFNNPPAGSDVMPLVAYPPYHSVLSKTFLGHTINTETQPILPAQQAAELVEALTVIFNHPNVPPFVSRRLIQRFVTSNPTPAYIQRVANVFKDNGSGVRGDLFATIKAILNDDEARNLNTAAGPDFGKLREPTLRLANWLRAFGATSASGNFLQPSDLNQPDALDEAPLDALTVFNFWLPDFTPAGSRLAQKGLVAPEFQAVDVLTTAAYVNKILSVIQRGNWGNADVGATYSEELALAASPADLIPSNYLAGRVNTLLFGGQIGAALYQRIVSVIEDTLPPSRSPTAAQIATANLNRVRNAVSLAMISTDYIVQR